MINFKIIDEIRKRIKEFNIDGIIINDPLNIRYILKNMVEQYVYLTVDNIYVVTNSLFFDVLKQEYADVNIINISTIEGKNELSELLRGKKIGIDANYSTLTFVNILKQKYMIDNVIEIYNWIEDYRAIKDEYEIESIREACNISAQAFKRIVKYIKPGQTEKEIKDSLEYYLKRYGADDVSFDAVVASGENTSAPHWVASNRKILEDDIVLLDFGCKVNGYCSDITRTIFVGSCIEKYAKIYDIVLEAQKKALNCIKEMTDVKDVDSIVKNEFTMYNIQDKFLHSTGHGLGLNVHESPIISDRNEYILKENMVLAVEPGIYLANDFGIRIEDTVVVTKNGYENLTNITKEKIII